MPLDVKLWDEATSAGKKTAGMEKSEAQMIAFTELTVAEQVTFLAEALKIMKKERAEGKDTIKESIDAYITGEPAKINEPLVTNSERSPSRFTSQTSGITPASGYL